MDICESCPSRNGTEDAAKVAKDTVYGAKGKSVHKIKKGSTTGLSKVNSDSEIENVRSFS